MTPTYYLLRHLSQYVDPGAVRLGTSGNVDSLAFRNPDGAIVTVLYNAGANPRETTLGIGDVTLQLSIPGRGWATVNWP